mmetsp:Transcript_41663/g.77652  ORF Transcript_41663/g.77652 Transcript_41663/m.77652 type:complete len:518 (+) Transcript_41663:64-1617(+)
MHKRAFADMANSGSRYVEEVPSEDSVYQAMVDTWLGEEEEHEGQSLQQERLELRADGKFTHSLSHRFALANDAPSSDDGSSCRGRWQLFKVRFFGADLSAEGDRELRFQADEGNVPVLVEKIVVCGVNPQLNGFLGAACRLYPASRSNDRSRPARSARRSPVRPSTASDEAEQDDAEPNISEAEIERLAAAVGRSQSECLAALLEHKGDAEAAASHLLECNQETGQDNAATYDRDEKVDEAQAAGLADATGHSLTQCIEALRLHSGNADSAVLYLLGLPPPGATSSSPSSAVAATDSAGGSGGASGAIKPAGVSEECRADVPEPPSKAKGVKTAAEGATEPPSMSEKMQVARLVEVTGQPFRRCLEALRANNGRPDSAVAELLSITDEPAAEPAGSDLTDSQPQDRNEDDVVQEGSDGEEEGHCDSPVGDMDDDDHNLIVDMDAFSRLDGDGDSGVLENDLTQGGGSTAAADFHAAVDAEVNAADSTLGTGADLDVGDEWGDADADDAPPWKRLRGS